MRHQISIQENVPLAPCTTFHVGGPAEFFVSADTIDALEDAVRWARERELQVTILGGGSNVLVSDLGARGLVIHIALRGISYQDAGENVRLIAAAGEVFDDVVCDSVSRNFWGLENLSGIPGCVGATPIQNVGAYGREVSDIIEWVDVYDTGADAVERMNASECDFGYRDSFFKTSDGRTRIVVSVAYILSRNPKPLLSYKDLAARFPNGKASISDIRDAMLDIRNGKFPDWNTYGTAGSFFKNPILPRAQYEALIKKYPDCPGFTVSNGQVKVALGWILDHVLHLRGVQEGRVGTYAHQALVLVNYGNATESEISSFADAITARVFAETKIKIEREVTLIK